MGRVSTLADPKPRDAHRLGRTPTGRYWMEVGQVTAGALEEIADAFNRHDVDAIMGFFAEDAVFEAPRGPDPWGRRFVGREQVREGFAARFAGIPDVHYGNATHWSSGDRGVSEWTLTGTTTDGERLEVRGCDLWTFRDGKVVRKDSYWKLVAG
jgi:ketosteroid isomerase-like protein